MMSKIVEAECSLASMGPPCTIVGGILFEIWKLNRQIPDIHGQFNDLLRMFSTVSRDKGICGAFQDNFVFLGDYVDRGRHSLECVCFVFALKCRYPQQVRPLNTIKDKDCSTYS